MNLVGNEISENKKKTQVYQVTHDGVGNRLPYMDRSFISFSYGGKFIEDFNLIVSTNERLDRSLYADFEDLITNNSVLDGQYYWGSHFTANKLFFILATDGISQNQLDNFKEWFCPGKTKELILAEHPNRAIMARIDGEAKISLMPFEEQVSIIVNGIEKNTSTTLYKGEIEISFIMDEPYWYSKLNYMPSYIDKETLEILSLENENINKVETIFNKDMLKIILEDGIPYQNDLSGNLFLGGDLLVTSESRINSALVGQAYLGVITGISQGLPANYNTPCYLFYSGTAKSYPKIKFSMNIHKNNLGYIDRPRNKITDGNNIFSHIYIQVGNDTDTKQIFSFTTPSILTGYNKAIQIFQGAEGKDKPAILNELQGINEYYSRAWAVKCLNDNFGNEIILANNTNLINAMKNFITNEATITFTIDSKTGEVLGSFPIRTVNEGIKTIQEYTGDMIKSDFIVLDKRNLLNNLGKIDLDNCYKITSDEELTNVLVFYKNMYL